MITEYFWVYLTDIFRDHERTGVQFTSEGRMSLRAASVRLPDKDG
jgi:hypothetical protein